jgi:hypothetical membrane protein
MSEQVQQARRQPPAPTNRGATRALAVAGIAGPVVFVVTVVVHGLLRADHDFVSDPAVMLMQGPGAWVQDANFVLLGLLVIAFAAGLHRGLPRTRWGALGPALLALSGVGPVLAGLTTPVPPHFLLVFAGACIGFAALSRRMAQDPHWRSLSGYTFATSVVILIVVPLHSALALPDGAPLHPWWGLLNHTALALWLGCVAVLAIRLLRAPGR